MTDNLPYADIVILALVAGFILLRLRSILGQKPGNDEGESFRRNLPPQATQEPIIRLSEKALKPKVKEPVEDAYLKSVSGTPLADTLKAIKLKDPEFDAAEFLGGAKMAYEMVFDGFAKGDKTPLKMLLSDTLCAQFEQEIDARANSETHSETTLVSVSAKDITRAELDRNIARLSVKFVCEQVTLVRDKEGAIVEGDPSRLHMAEDEWTFERDLTSKNPNWKIIET